MLSHSVTLLALIQERKAETRKSKPCQLKAITAQLGIAGAVTESLESWNC